MAAPADTAALTQMRLDAVGGDTGAAVAHEEGIAEWSELADRTQAPPVPAPRLDGGVGRSIRRCPRVRPDAASRGQARCCGPVHPDGQRHRRPHQLAHASVRAPGRGRRRPPRPRPTAGRAHPAPARRGVPAVGLRRRPGAGGGVESRGPPYAGADDAALALRADRWRLGGIPGPAREPAAAGAPPQASEARERGQRGRGVRPAHERRPARGPPLGEGSLSRAPAGRPSRALRSCRVRRPCASTPMWRVGRLRAGGSCWRSCAWTGDPRPSTCASRRTAGSAC